MFNNGATTCSLTGIRGVLTCPSGYGLNFYKADYCVFQQNTFFFTMQNVRMLQGVIPPNIRQLYYKEVKKENSSKNKWRQYNWAQHTLLPCNIQVWWSWSNLYLNLNSEKKTNPHVEPDLACWVSPVTQLPLLTNILLQLILKAQWPEKNKTPNLSLRPECLLQNIICKPKGLAQPSRAVKNHNSTTEVILIRLKDRKILKKNLTFLRGSHVTEVVQLRRGWTQTVTA